jgi:hypothetical protein
MGGVKNTNRRCRVETFLCVHRFCASNFFLSLQITQVLRGLSCLQIKAIYGLVSNVNRTNLGSLVMG